MRRVSVLALVASSLALAACAGGGGLDSAADLAGDLDVCGLSCGGDTGGGDGGSDGGTDAPPDTDGDGTPDDEDTDGSTGSGAGGNDTSLTSLTGDTTIALEKSKLLIPDSGSSHSLLSMSATATKQQTTTAILSANKPTQMKVSIDTETDSNGTWAETVYMDEYVYGSQDTEWFDLGHYITGVANLVDAGGNVIGGWDAVDGRYEYTSGVAIPESAFRDPVLAAQIMDSRANGGAGTGYREYRIKSSGQNRDEVLQVWAWGNSYATQYRNEIEGGSAKNQTWSFGGNATSAMPTGGSATYAGRFVGTAETENWLEPTGAEINPNALWMIQGASNVTADFGAGTVNGTLNTETWTSFQEDGWYTWTTGTAGTATEPDYSFYNQVVTLDGTITGSTFAGTATLDGGFISEDNPMYGGFFGANAAETTGIFNVYGTTPSPIGGSTGQNDPREGILIMNGAFHGDCTTSTNGIC